MKTQAQAKAKASLVLAQQHFSGLRFLCLSTLLAFQLAATSAFALKLEVHPELAKQGETVEVLLREPASAASGTDAADGATPPVVRFRDKSYKAFLLPASKAGQSAEPAGGKSAEPASGKSAEPAGGKSAEPASGKSAEPAGGKSAEPAGGKSAEPAVGKSAVEKDVQSASATGNGAAPSSERVWRLLIGIPADLPPGNYSLQSGKLVKQIKVVDAGFGVQVIRLPQGKDNFNGSPGEPEAVEAAKKTLSPNQYWEGKFLHPSKARISSPFGMRRRVNGVLLKDYFHSGLDFAGGAGSPVLACQSGKVLIAHQGWKLHGNTICIDHGQGVVSFYIHLSRIFVKEGDIVRAGQKIGAIGSTGRANGPHLHFSIYVNQDATNPLNWFNRNY